MRTVVGAVAVTLAVGVSACTHEGEKGLVIEAIRQEIAGEPDAGRVPQVWEDVRRFYEARGFAPAWMALDAADQPPVEVLAVLRRANDHGLSPADYDEPDLAREVDAFTDRGRDWAMRTGRLDVRLTRALLSLGRDVALGRTPSTTIDPRWKARRPPPDLPATLARAQASNLGAWLNVVRPQHPEYTALQRVLADRTHAAASSDDEISRIALNMERWRWMPEDLGARHVLVNVPAFHMAVREKGQAVFGMKVMVGKVGHETPIFSGNMATVVFSPYWNVPDSIAEGETAPAAARDPDYLRRNNMEIVRVSRRGTEVLEPSEIDWTDPDGLEGLSFRQLPGADNALGHVKFLFPNPYEVYLHDTPADGLFARQGRALSHGCIRLEQPEQLARYVVRDRPEWTAARIDEAMLAGTERHVALTEKLPVHIVYFTVWPNGAGGVDTWPDVYGYDARQRGTAAAR